MTRKKPTPAEENLPKECCFWCHHARSTWQKNYPPDPFTNNDWDVECKFTPLDSKKKSDVCEKFTTCYYYHTPDEFKYPFVVTMGMTRYAFHTQEEYQTQRKIWLEGLHL